MLSALAAGVSCKLAQCAKKSYTSPKLMSFLHTGTLSIPAQNLPCESYPTVSSKKQLLDV